jgi:hypothetical protein
MRARIPLRQRPFDLFYVLFFAVNLVFVTYLIDIEQLVIADPSNFQYPLWPPRDWIDLVHRYGRDYDPLLLARPMWWKVAIWWDVLAFGPFYAMAVPAFVAGKEWIRIPTIVYASALLTILTIILAEEIWGSYRAPFPEVVIALNLPWLLVAVSLLLRMGGSRHPFTRPAHRSHRSDEWSM